MVSKWEIYYCNLDPTVGSEQKGTRPVLVVSADAVNHHLPVSTALPLSSVEPGERIYPTEVLLGTDISGLPKPSVAMLQQIRTVSHARLTNLAGKLTDVATQKKFWRPAAIILICKCRIFCAPRRYSMSMTKKHRIYSNDYKIVTNGNLMQ
jgi:mRNA interferase MazF